MEERGFRFSFSEEEIHRLVLGVQSTFAQERGELLAIESLTSIVARVLLSELDSKKETLYESFTLPDGHCFREVKLLLERSAITAESESAHQEFEEQLELFEDEPNDLNGRRVYSAKKYAAMIEYISHAGKNIFQTNLNKLLFYSDFWFFYLRNVGISGAIYRKLPFGPVFDGYKNLLTDLERRRQIRPIHLEVNGKRALIIRSKKTYDPSKSILSKEERKMIDWTLEQLGDLPSKEISDRSHEENAYKNTRKGYPISYNFAKMLNLLPPRDLLD